MLNAIRKRAERLIRKLRIKICPVPFVVWFRERSGSTHLCSILGSHPQIACRQEDFHEVIIEDCLKINEDSKAIQIGRDIYCHRRISQFDANCIDNPSSKEIVTQLYDIFACPTHASGFKLKYPTQDRLYPEVMEELSTLGSKLHVISLSRRNVLKQAISSQNMQRIRNATNGTCFNLTHLVDPETKDQFSKARFSIHVDQVITYAKQLQRERAGFEQRISQFQENCRNPILKIDYEELLTDEADTVARVLEYLGVASEVKCFSLVQKATNDRLSESIENYEELATAVRNTDLATMLE